jgi:fumarate reductase flavoprotein subunit
MTIDDNLPGPNNPLPGPIIAGIKRNIQISKQKYSFETSPAQIRASEITENITADVVVVGAGISGVSAALSAAEEKAKVVLIEKTNTYHGYGGHMAALGSKLQKELGINIDKDEVILNLMKYAANRPDQRLIRMWAYGSGEVMDRLMVKTSAAGLKVSIDQFPPPSAFNNANEYYPQYNATHDFYFSEKQVVKCLMENALKRGATIYFNMNAKQLLRDKNKRVTGVIARNSEGKYKQYSANKGVILCTGDYANNPEMIARYCPEVEELGLIRTATGDGHQMAMWIGAMMEPGPHAKMIHPAPAPLGNCAYLQVNIRGERFQNEDVPCECYCSAVRRQPGKTAWQIFDSKYKEAFPNMGIGHMKRNQDTEGNDTLVEKEALKAFTLTELAEKIGVPAEKFKATVERYNELSRLGKDLDFGKRSDRLTTIEFPPFYAGKTDELLFGIMGGIMVNPCLQPIDNNWEGIPGLYLGGNIMGGRYGVEYPSMLPGLSNGMAMYFGRVAGLNAASSRS